MRHLLRLACVFILLHLGGCHNSGSANGPGPSVMFWLDSGNLAIEGFSVAHPALFEPVAIDRVVLGSNTGLSANASAMALDPVGNRLFVASGTRILVFDNATAANGNMAPSRTISASPAFVNVASLSLDATRNLLYVGDRNTGGSVPSIYVVANASTATNVTPVSITDGSTPDRRFVHIDAANNVLYVADTCQISVFNLASTLSGAKAPDRQFANCPTLTGGDHPLWLDPGRSQIYVLDPSAGDPGVVVFDNASTASGAVPAARTIASFTTSGLRNLLLDASHDRLYVATTPGLFIIDAASTRNGRISDATVPSQLLSGIQGLDMAAVAVNTTLP